MKTFILTGASKGIGKAIAKKLAGEGHRIIGISRKEESYPLDLSDINALPEKLKELQKKHPNIDGLICNAGRGLFGNLEELSFAEMQSLINLNFLSHVYLIKTYLPHFKKKKRGDIILIGSEAARNGKRRGSLYAASKFALRGFAQALREECASSNIRVSLINPGMVATSFFDTLSFCPGSQEAEHIKPEDVADSVALVINMRPGTVFDEINLSPQKKVVVNHSSRMTQ